MSENTNIGDTVFQVSYYDADGDTVNFTTTYAPAACSSLFAVGASGMFKKLTQLNEPRHDKMCLREFLTRPDTNRPAQPQKLASVLKFRL